MFLKSNCEETFSDERYWCNDVSQSRIITKTNWTDPRQRVPSKVHFLKSYNFRSNDAIKLKLCRLLDIGKFL